MYEYKRGENILFANFEKDGITLCIDFAQVAMITSAGIGSSEITLKHSGSTHRVGVPAKQLRDAWSQLLRTNDHEM